MKKLSLLLLILTVSACGPKYRVAPEMKVDANDAVLVERGRYIARHVAGCEGCHTYRTFDDMSVYKGPEFAGGMTLDEDLGFPGIVVSRNLTPEGLGTWTDGEIARAIREGVRKDNTTIFPFMPYAAFKEMSDNDVKAVVAFLRTLPPAKNPVEKVTDIDFPVSMFVKMAPQPLTGPVMDPPVDDPVARGKYLLTLAGCHDCHSAQSKGMKVEGRELAGGVKFTYKEDTVISSNITPDKETGIGNYTQEDFINLIRTGVKKNGSPIALNLMPWFEYKGMTDKDLSEMWTYMQTIKPVKLDVTNEDNQVGMGG